MDAPLSEPVTLSVGAVDARQRLDEFLAGRFGAISRMRLRQAIASGEVTLNGEPAHAGRRLIEGETVVCTFGELAPTAMTPEAIPLAILYEDAFLAVVEKPAGMLAHPVRHYKSGTLANALTYHFNRDRGDDEPWVRPGLPHRLDRATSGLMVVAKTQRALSRLTIAFQNRAVEKQYLAAVYGRLDDEEGAIDAPIGYDPDRRPHWCVMAEGRPARSRYRADERRDGVTLLRLEPLTGRTNQLRIHCAHRGHPIVGDPEFGIDLVIGRYAGVAAGYSPPPRLFLHAHALGFAHPITGEAMRFEAPLPAELANWWAATDDWHSAALDTSTGT